MISPSNTQGIKWLQFPPVAAMEINGITHEIHGPSIIGEHRFAQHMVAIGEILDVYATDTLWLELYRTSAEFRYHIHQALECWRLPTDLPPEVIQGLLLYQTDTDGKASPGYLPQIMAAKNAERLEQADQKSATLAEGIAALASYLGDLNQAMELATEAPADMAAEIVQAKVELELTPEQRKDRANQKLKTELMQGGNFLDKLERAKAAAREET